MAQDPEGMAVLRRGFRVLVDKLGLVASLRSSAAQPPATGLPDQAVVGSAELVRGSAGVPG